MPKKEFVINNPSDIKFVDPVSKKEIEGEGNSLSFKDFVHRLMMNPIWMENYINVKAANAIMKELDGGGPLTLVEEDYNLLKKAAENPKQLVNTPFGTRENTGYGFLPPLTPQLLPFIEAITDAKEKKD